MTSSFERLGLLPSLISKLNEQQIGIVVKEAGRGLQLIFHPDRTGGDGFRSVLINEAVRSLDSRMDIRDAKIDYLANGPGQREIEAAENELAVTQMKLESLKENIRRTKERKETVAKATSDLGWIDHLIEAAHHSELANEFPVSGIGVERSIWGLYLRHSTGIKFSLAIYDVSAEIEELKELLEKDKIVDEREKTWIKDETSMLKYNKQLDSGVSSEQLSVQRENIEYKKEKRRERKNKIKELRTKIRKATTGEKTKGHIDENGFIFIGGKNTGMMLVGSSPNEESSMIPFGFSDELKFAMLEGEYLIGTDTKGKMKSFGILQKVGWKKPQEKKAKAKKAPKGAKATASDDIFSGIERKSERLFEEEFVEERQIVVRKEMMDLAYKKNPFEVIGILPSVVRELGPEDLKTFVKYVSKALVRVLHPDSGGKAGEFVELKAALKVLEQEDSFETARGECAKTDAGDGVIAKLEEIGEKVKKEMIGKIPELASVKAELKKLEEEKAAKRTAMERLGKLLVTDVFSAVLMPWDNLPYLRLSKGSKLTISDDGRRFVVEMQKKGFDMLAASEEFKKPILLFGCAPPGKFASLENAKEQLEGRYLWQIMENVEPLLHEGGILIGVEPGANAKVVGMVDSIERGTELAKRMGEGLKPKVKKTPARAGPRNIKK